MIEYIKSLSLVLTDLIQTNDLSDKQIDPRREQDSHERKRNQLKREENREEKSNTIQRGRRKE